MLIENMKGQCWHCGHSLAGTDYSRESVCQQCKKATHACKNCLFYKPGIANDCREPVAEPVMDKQRANFCDYFEPGADVYSERANEDTLRKAAEDLFN